VDLEHILNFDFAGTLNGPIHTTLCLGECSGKQLVLDINRFLDRLVNLFLFYYLMYLSKLATLVL